MPRKRRKRTTTVIVSQASDVELTRRNSRNSLSIEVRSGNELLGTLALGRGSVEWWPNGNSKNALKKSWTQFAKLLEANMG